MPKTDDHQLRQDFVSYLRQLKQSWTIASEAEKSILLGILKHKGPQLVFYSAQGKPIAAIIQIALCTSISLVI
jgi:hypothetical protein